MASNRLDRPITTRRRFVIDALGGLAGTALVGACGSAETTGVRGNAGGAATLATAGTGGTGGSPAFSGGQPGTPTGGAGGVVDAAGGSGGAGGLTDTGGSSGGVGASDSGLCAVYPQETEGPFYLDLGLLRSDITEQKPGAALILEIQVVKANGCVPIKDCAVDVWQCDATGVYAGFPGQLGGLDTTGEKFLRGTQVTDSDGRVVFRTIYPGWYPGRTTHIHFKAHLSATSVVTSQMYFPEATTMMVYLAAPYDVHGPKDTANAADATAQTGGMPPVLAINETAMGMTATLVVSVLG